MFCYLFLWLFHTMGRPSNARNLTKNDHLVNARGHTMSLSYSQLAELFRTSVSTLSALIRFPDRPKSTLRLRKTIQSLDLDQGLGWFYGCHLADQQGQAAAHQHGD